MHKLSNFPAQARHGWEKMAPSTSFSFSRSNHEMPVSAPIKRPSTATTSAPPVIAPGTQVNLSFNVPFSSNLQGPDPDDIMWASPGAKARWTHAEGTAEGTPTHKLPVHAQNVDKLRNLCREVSEQTDGRVSAVVTSAESKPLPGLQRGPLRALVTNVCLSGELEIVNSMRCRILNSTPISLRSSFVDIDSQLIIDPPSQNVRGAVLNQLDLIAKATKADMFLLMPKQPDIETASFHGNMDTGMDPRLRCQIYGDLETMEHAKTRVLIMIDQILKRSVDTMKLELTMHTLICGRGRKNIKMIESATGTAIYFPPPFPRLFGYTPHGAQRRPDDLVYITGENPENILRAKQRLHDLVMSTKVFVKPVMVTDTKLDAILLERLDKVRKIIENNGSYILLPPLGVQRGLVRVQGTDVLHVERTVRELMQLAGQFYSASWFITHPDPTQRPPTPADVRAMLSDICINSGAEVSFEKLNFHIYGSDDAVRAALMVISNIPFVKKSQYNMSVKIELANEHKEFVSGKKNGKINKIMSHSSVQIVFDGFNEYNFYIVVRGAQYEATKNGLDLVEQEMPASISFHVPDQYHKRIIGIGGQHIQRIMKKYSVFVKFSNAMDRGGFGKEEDDIKVDNVICRTPARNAQNLDLVKQEIMDMVEKADAEFVSETININRLYHRELIARLDKIDELEKKFNCKITFPSTEEASDIVTVSGPEYQVPFAVDEFLGMVPESHDLAFPSSTELSDHIRSAEFKADILDKLKTQHEVDAQLQEAQKETSDGKEETIETFHIVFTRNNAGGLKDAIDFLLNHLVMHGLDTNTVRGALPRPKSDSFEDSLPFFESKLLQRAEPAVESTDSPTRSHFGGDDEPRGMLDRLRKPGSMSSFTSIFNGRKNTNSPGSLFKHASSNASKASLASLESTGSYRNPWNDSGINLADDEHHTNGWPMPAPRFESKFPFGSSSAAAPGDVTPRYDARGSVDSGRPSTSHSASGYPAPIGPPR
ncbi:kh domain protein [Pyrenophora tritici-repentis]|nr:kh domain protein [Pyrenophora tritici-repentis]